MILVSESISSSAKSSFHTHTRLCNALSLHHMHKNTHLYETMWAWMDRLCICASRRHTDTHSVIKCFCFGQRQTAHCHALIHLPNNNQYRSNQHGMNISVQRKKEKKKKKRNILCKRETKCVNSRCVLVFFIVRAIHSRILVYGIILIRNNQESRSERSLARS